MATALLCISPFLTVDISAESLWCYACFLTGVFFGSHLPDMDVAAAEGLNTRSCIGFVFSCISLVIVSIVRIVYHVMGCRFNSRHRHSLHTVCGVFVATVAIAVITGILFEDVGWWSYNIPFLYAGIFCGALLHLAEDCCTISGLHPFMPVISLHLKGGINTGDYGDHRPVRYAKFLICMSAGVISGQYVYHIPAGRFLVPVLVLAVFSWVVFYFLSQHPHARRR